MFGRPKGRDRQQAIVREHQKLYRSHVRRGQGASDAHETALLEVIARHTPDVRGRPQSVASAHIRSEAIPFLLLPGGKSLDVLAEYLAWRDTGDEKRLGYLRGMLSLALRTDQRWPRSVLQTLGGNDFEQTRWFGLLRPTLQARLHAVHEELGKRALEHLQIEAAAAL